MDSELVDGCPVLEALPKDSADCPEELDLVNCDTPGLAVGDLCESDGECGTDKGIDNCRNEIHKGADIYRVTALAGGSDPAPAPDPAPALAVPAAPAESGAVVPALAAPAPDAAAAADDDLFGFLGARPSVMCYAHCGLCYPFEVADGDVVCIACAKAIDAVVN